MTAGKRRWHRRRHPSVNPEPLQSWKARGHLQAVLAGMAAHPQLSAGIGVKHVWGRAAGTVAAVSPNRGMPGRLLGPPTATAGGGGKGGPFLDDDHVICRRRRQERTQRGRYSHHTGEPSQPRQCRWWRRRQKRNTGSIADGPCTAVRSLARSANSLGYRSARRKHAHGRVFLRRSNRKQSRKAVGETAQAPPTTIGGPTAAR
jgi:hypothetical protein